MYINCKKRFYFLEDIGRVSMNSKKCPNCFREKIPEANFCFFCGHCFLTLSEQISFQKKIQSIRIREKFYKELKLFLSKKFTSDTSVQDFIIEKILKKDEELRKLVNNKLLKAKLEEALSMVERFFYQNQYIVRHCLVCKKISIILASELKNEKCYNCSTVFVEDFKEKMLGKSKDKSRIIIHSALSSSNIATICDACGLPIGDFGHCGCSH